MTAYTISPIWGAGAQLFDNNGNPLSGGKIYTYAAGTTTPAVTYTTPTGSVANSNPIIANSAGRLTNEIWLPVSGAYKFVLKTSNDVLLATYDNIPTTAQPPIVNDASSISYEQGYEVNAGNFTIGATYVITSVGNTDFVAIGASANQVGILFIATGIGSGTGTAQFSRTVAQKLQETVSVKDFGAVGDGVTDNTAAILAALTAAGTNGFSVYFPGSANSYIVSDEFTIPANVTVYGDGYSSTIEQTVEGKNVFIAGDNTVVQFLHIKMCPGNNLDITKQHCVAIGNVANVRVSNNWLELVDVNCGVFIAGGDQCLIENNYIYGGTWAASGPAATVSDILTYSASPNYGTRIIIKNNYCLSDNSQGIAIDLLGGEGKIIVDGNVCESAAGPSTNRRHGIIIGYNPDSIGGPDAIVTNNICRYTTWTGIYKPNTTIGSVLIANNICSYNGFDTTNTLSGGIFAYADGNVTIDNNIVQFFQNTNSSTGAITIVGAASSTKPTKISNNQINSSSGKGLIITTGASKCLVDGNVLSNNTDTDIEYQPSAGLTTIGNHWIQNNVIYRNSGYTISAIRVDMQSSTLNTFIKNNIISGVDGTVSSITNAGVYVIGPIPEIVQIIENKINNFYYGVYLQSYFSTARHFDTQYENNLIENCTNGFYCAGISNVPSVPLVNNRFVNVTNQTTGGGSFSVGYISTKFVNNIIGAATSVPTIGTWAIGDRFVNSSPAVGFPKSWVCTVAGNPGTWVSEGNL